MCFPLIENEYTYRATSGLSNADGKEKFVCSSGKVISSAADIDTPNVCAYIKYSVCSYVVVITLWLLLLLLWCFMHLGYVWPEKCASMGQYITIPDRDRIYVEYVCCIVWYAQ